MDRHDEHTTSHPTSAHWGAYDVLVADDRVVGVRPGSDDTDPSPISGNVPEAQHHATRVAAPAVRRRWLENGPGADDLRGSPHDEYVELDWGALLDLLAAEFDRVRREHGNAAIYGGSYGWASAGRFHHSQSQVHRFLNTIGGYTRSRDTYSHACVEVLLPRVVGVDGTADLLERAPTWAAVARHTDLVVTFGGLRLSNTWNASGGRARQTAAAGMRAAAGAGVATVSVSPLRDDTVEEMGAEWLPAAPGTDTAVQLALIHTLFAEDLVDRVFLGRCTVGADVLRDYVTGVRDGVAKTPEWAEDLCGLSADTLRRLTRRMAGGRTLVNVGWSVQRTRFGEQPLWGGVALAACLGQIGLPGGGFATGYGSTGNYAGGSTPSGLPRFLQGPNPIDSAIPVARVADMLLHPGEPYDYNGDRCTYPDIRMVVWSGGNPFHHHQNLARLTRAFGRPETVVVAETHWTATARHADIVLPSTTSLERDDIAASQGDLRVRAMPRAVAPHGSARDEYDVYADLADRLGVRARFTEGRTSAQWLRHIYEQWRARYTAPPPDFDAFWAAGGTDIPDRVEDTTLFGGFRADPDTYALATPSGRIELFSRTIDSFGYDDCPGHPAWLPASERLGTERSHRWPLLLVANQPRARLHSQHDMGAYSRSQEVAGRARMRMHPGDARARGIADGDVVRVHNDRGSLLAGVETSDDVRPDVVQLSTGAWYDPSSPEATCVHGNPNVLTADTGSSALSQGTTGQHVLVEVDRYEGDPPPVRVFDPPQVSAP